MPIATLALSLLVAVAEPPASPQAGKPAEEEELTVTGKRPDPREDKAEEPYSTTPRVMLGSRIPRKPGRRMFNTVATDTGLAGLIPGPENNFDATGGMAPAFKDRHVKVCKADREQVTEETACAILEARKKMEKGDHEAASKALAPVLASGSISRLDRYYANHYAYLLAERAGDEPGRERALKGMLTSGRMPEVDRPAALKTLVAMALRRGDQTTAIAQLEALVEAAPEDARSLANLAALHAGRGDHARARPLMTAAVAAKQVRGEAPPPSWTDYLETAPR